MSAVLRDVTTAVCNAGEKLEAHPSRKVEWVRISDAILDRFNLSGNYFISREALDTLSGDGTTLFDVLDWFNGFPESFSVGDTARITSTLEVYFGYDAGKPNGACFFVQIDLIRTQMLTRRPHEMTFAEFEKVAFMVKLENHGRRWEVSAGGESFGFADAPTRTGAAREVHAREVNNAVYWNQPGAPDIVNPKPSMPPAAVLDEYPELGVKFPAICADKA